MFINIYEPIFLPIIGIPSTVSDWLAASGYPNIGRPPWFVQNDTNVGSIQIVLVVVQHQRLLI